MRPAPERRLREPPARVEIWPTTARPPPRPTSPVPETPIFKAWRRASLSVAVNFAYSGLDRKSTRLNSSHANISYAVFCLKKKKTLPTLQYCLSAIALEQSHHHQH